MRTSLLLSLELRTDSGFACSPERSIGNRTKRCTEINFLVVHKKLRSKRFAPTLIQEVTRRTHLRGIFQAIYTAGVFLPTPVSRCQYYHRSLNPAKLVKLGFSAVPRNSTVARMSTYYRVPAEPTLPGLRELEKRDLKQASRLIRAYMARFDMAPLLSNKDIEHALWTGRGKDVNGKREGQVTWAYVVEVCLRLPSALVPHQEKLMPVPSDNRTRSRTASPTSSRSTPSPPPRSSLSPSRTSTPRTSTTTARRRRLRAPTSATGVSRSRSRIGRMRRRASGRCSARGSRRSWRMRSSWWPRYGLLPLRLMVGWLDGWPADGSMSAN